jgi:hypothetical protein
MNFLDKLLTHSSLRKTFLEGSPFGAVSPSETRGSELPGYPDRIDQSSQSEPMLSSSLLSTISLTAVGGLGLGIGLLSFSWVGLSIVDCDMCHITVWYHQHETEFCFSVSLLIIP